jgi:hypothetical protein
MTKTFAFVTDKFYYEFVITPKIARVTKRAFKGVKFNDQSTTMSIERARSYYKQLAATN